MGKNEAKIEKTSTQKYSPSSIEKHWQSKWEEEGIYQSDLDSAKKPFYNLMMFPYPSAEGLHVGSVFAFSGADIYGRFKRMHGFDVFEPMGLDGFGIHSENHAIKTGSHPMEHAKRTEENFYRQLHSIGNSFAWKSKVETYDPGYYKWTQWLFIQLFKAGLAYRKKSPVNYCPSCKTVLSDEQVIEGKCERCGSVVEKRELEQWFFRITGYAGRLLKNIPSLDWSEKVKTVQKNWIGQKIGINIRYKVHGLNPDLEKEFEIEVFTTRPDTNFGATFIALAPESPITQKILGLVQNAEISGNILDYIEKVKNKSEIERLAEGREKTGVFTGLYAVNSLTGYKMPIWIADFVLAGFGTGALVGVPGHDKRDFEFAQKFNLEIIRVVSGKDGDKSAITRIEQVQEEEGIMINSGFLNGLSIHKATEKIMDYIEEKGYGRRETTYRLRDWLISRQRYWGPPIPMIYCADCAKRGLSWFTSDEAKKQKQIDKNKAKIHDPRFQAHNAEQMPGWYPVPDSDLPVLLPYVKDFKPMGTGKSPLSNSPEFYNVVCPRCASQAQRETDVSDTFLDSSWYFLRYLSPDWDDIPFPSEKLAGDAKLKTQSKQRSMFLPVTMYIGGAEHSVLHLMYSRFVAMVLHDLGYLEFEEPFKRFYAHGLLIKDGAKMSKSRGNVINPDEYVQKYGADTLRMYLHFLGPFNEDGDFRDTGIEGMHRFLKRLYVLFSQPPASVQLNEESLRMMHKTIKEATEELENLRYNTAIAKLMTWYNFLSKQKYQSREEVENFLKLLAPLAPHLSEELFQKIASAGAKQQNPFISIHRSTWPQFDPAYLEEDTVTIAVQVNGKLRSTIKTQKLISANQKNIENLAVESLNSGKHLEGKNILKVIYVPGKIINFVVN